MMITKYDIAQEAKTWISTPFHHQGRGKYLGVDCIGLLVGVCKELNLKSDLRDKVSGRIIPLHELDEPNYSRLPNNNQLQGKLKQFFKEITTEKVDIADILLFSIDKWPQHIGIVTDYIDNEYFFVHSTEPVGRVMFSRYDQRFKRLTTGIYRFYESALQV